MKNITEKEIIQSLFERIEEGYMNGIKFDKAFLNEDLFNKIHIGKIIFNDVNCEILKSNSSQSWLVDSSKLDTKNVYLILHEKGLIYQGALKEFKVNDFLEYIKQQRKDTARVVATYDVHNHKQLRTAIDDLLIAYDQMTAKLSEQRQKSDIEQLNIADVSGCFPSENDITNAFVTVRDNNKKHNLDYRDRDYFQSGVEFAFNYLLNELNNR